jgi:hypothetical protein
MRLVLHVYVPGLANLFRPVPWHIKEENCRRWDSAGRILPHSFYSQDCDGVAVTPMRPLPTLLALAFVSVALLPLASAAPSSVPACPVGDAACATAGMAMESPLRCGGYVCNLIDQVCQIVGQHCIL